MKPTETKYCFSYIRFSSSRQKHGSSVERQTPIAERVANEKNWRYMPQWNAQNLGVSAFKGDNVKTIKSIIEARNANKIPFGSVLILEALDRATRLSLDDAQQLIRSILRSGLEIYTDMNKRHLTAASLNNLGDIISTAVELDAAYQYVKRMSDRSLGGIAKGINSITKGQKHYFGGFMPSWIAGIDAKGKWIIDQTKLDVVLRIFREYQSGKTLGQIINGLNADTKSGKISAGLKRKSALAKVWGRGTIRCVLDNACITGTWKFKGVEYPNYLPTYLSQKEFDVIQAKLKHNKDRRGGNFSGNVNNIFRGLCTCKHCGGNVGVASVNREGNNRYSYFGCIAGIRYKKCKATRRLSMRMIEQNIFERCLAMSPSDFLTEDSQAHLKEIEATQAALTALDRKAARVNIMLDDDNANLEEIKTLAANIKTQRIELTEQLKTLSAKRNVASSLPENVQAFKNMIETLTPAEKKELAPIIQSFNRITNKKPDVRKKLLNLMPSIIKDIQFDLCGKSSFTVTLTSGKQWTY